MTSSDMLDYTFGLLDEPRRIAFERNLQANPDLAEKVARLGSAVGQLLDDGDDLEPPVGLASRTVALVETRKRRPQLQDFAPTRVPFRWTDVAVAASVFLAGLLTLTVPIMQSRQRMDQASCANTLRRLGVGLANYASTHGSFPFIPTGEPAGSYGVILNGTRDIMDPAMLTCPSDLASQKRAPLPDYDRFRKLIKTSPELGRKLVGGHFAYNSGYAEPSGVVPVPCFAAARVPIAADGPVCDVDGKIQPGNSMNHGGRGQNVLFSDAHVEWRRNRWMSNADPDVFLNADNHPARGVHAGDASVMHAGMPVRDH